MVILPTLLLLAASPPQDEIKTAKPPHGAIVLFDGKDLSKWKHRGSGKDAAWTVEGGTVTVKPGAGGDIVTREDFGDYRLHVEFNIPLMPDKHSQERGNSGVYNQGRYEVQVLDSYNNPTYAKGGCGALYEIKDPDKNMAKPPGEWQWYDIVFRAPRFDADGKLTEHARITVSWNGEKVHNNVELPNFTRSGIEGALPKTGPILLQDHGCPVKYRNIWIEPLKDAKP